MTRAIATCTLALTCALPAHAAAAGWSRPASFDARLKRVGEPTPRVAIAPDGTSAAGWTKGPFVMISTGARGRFSAPRRVGRLRAGEPAVAAAPGGAALVAWEASDGVRVALRRRTGGRWVIRRVATSTGSEINAVVAIHDPRGGWVIAERQFPRTSGLGMPYHVRALTLERDGTPVGTPQDLGLGEIALDARPSGALAVDARGVVTLAFRRERPPGDSGTSPLPVVVTQRVHHGRFGPPLELRGARTSDAFADPRVAAAPAGGALVAVTDIANCGDAGCFGLPALARLTGSDLTPAASPALARPNRAFGPWVAPTGTGAVLVFSYKDTPAAFSRIAPVQAVAVRADGSFGAVQRLTGSVGASEPVALPLDRGRVLAMWVGARGWGAAVAGRDGRFRADRGPVGPPPSFFHSNPTNRDVRTAGRWAIVGWARNARVRLSVRAF